MGMTAAAVTVVSAVSQAKNQRKEGKHAAAIQIENARIAELQAQDAEERGRIAVDEKRLDIEGVIGAQRAVFGAQGIEMNDPDESTGLLQLSTREQGEIDVLTIRNNAAREAWGYRVQSSNFRSQAELEKTASRNRATGTILTGFTQGYSQYRTSTGGLSVPKSPRE
jgi:hypothetical protein